MSLGSPLQRTVSWCLLALMGILQVPVSAGVPRARLTKDTSVPFPCQDRACGCLSAEQCYSSCCCFTPEERRRFASEQGVDADRYGLDDLTERRETESTYAKIAPPSPANPLLVRLNKRSSSCCLVSSKKESPDTESPDTEARPISPSLELPGAKLSLISAAASTSCGMRSSAVGKASRAEACAESPGCCTQVSTSPSACETLGPTPPAKIRVPGWSAYLKCRGITPAWSLFTAMTFFDRSENSIPAPVRGDYLPLANVRHVPMNYAPETPPPRYV
jgi:hypothetical protein